MKFEGKARGGLWILKDERYVPFVISYRLLADRNANISYATAGFFSCRLVKDGIYLSAGGPFVRLSASELAWTTGNFFFFFWALNSSSLSSPFCLSSAVHVSFSACVCVCVWWARFLRESFGCIPSLRHYRVWQSDSFAIRPIPQLLYSCTFFFFFTHIKYHSERSAPPRRRADEPEWQRCILGWLSGI